MRTFIRHDDVALLLKDNRRLREPGLDWRFRTIERVDEAIEWTPFLEFRGPVAFRVRVPA